MLGLAICLPWCPAHDAKPGRVILKLLHDASVVLKVTFLTILTTSLSGSCDIFLFLLWGTQNIFKCYIFLLSTSVTLIVLVFRTSCQYLKFHWICKPGFYIVTLVQITWWNTRKRKQKSNLKLQNFFFKSFFP